MIETAVGLSDLGLTLAEAVDAGLVVDTDWRGEPAVATVEAAQWVAVREAATAEHERLWAEHQAESRRWQEARDEAARKANAGARARVRGGPGMQFSVGVGAGTEAAANYERTVPRPVWHGNGRPSVALEYVTADEAPGVARRAVRALRERLGGEAEVPA